MFGGLFGGKKKANTTGVKMSPQDAAVAELNFLKSLNVPAGSDAEKMVVLFEHINEALLAKGTLPEHNE